MMALALASAPGWALAADTAKPPVAKPAAAAATAAAPSAARLVPASSEVTFTAKQLGVPLDGRFKRFDAQIALDPRQPQTGKVAFQIELGSVAINAETDAELAQATWFNTGKFPKATFVSSGIKAVGAGKFEVAGTLTIKGQAKPLVVPVSLAQSAGTTTATGAFAIKRLDFKIGDGDWADPSVVANDVQVRFKLTLQGLAPL
ncbi:MAG: YceI family protein [Rubrivivax sp.]|nr:MAG: YceI family protein [Rubrivivax sp.]